MSETNVATPKRSLIRKAIGFLVRSAIVLGVALLFALAAQRFVDSTTIFASIPSNFQWQYLLAGIGLLAFSLCLRFRAGVVLAALFVLFQLPAFWPYYFGGEPCAESANLRLGVANVYGANRHFRQFGEWVSQEKPDVLLLQETNEKWPAYLEEFKTDYPHHRMMTSEHWGFNGTTLSRFPIVEYEVLLLPDDQYPAQRVVIEVGETKVALYNLHLMLTGPRRTLQNEFLRERLSREPYPCVLAGDFNATIWAAGQRDLIDQTKLRNAAFGYGYQSTWPGRVKPLLAFFMSQLSGRPWGGRFSTEEKLAPYFARYFGIPLDHVYVSPEIGVVNFARGPGVNSDHLPLLVDLFIPNAK